MKVELLPQSLEGQGGEKKSLWERLTDYLKQAAVQREEYWATHPDETPSALDSIDKNLPHTPRQSS